MTLAGPRRKRIRRRPRRRELTRAESQRSQEMGLETVSSRVYGLRAAERGELRHFEALVAARVDAREGLEIEIHVHREAVEARAPAHADADARELAAVDVNARRVATAFGNRAKLSGVVDDGTLQRGDEVTYAELRAA